jgi:hypothetical protein
VVEGHCLVVLLALMSGIVLSDIVVAVWFLV